MKPSLTRVLLCVLPLLIGVYVVVRAFQNYGTDSKPRFNVGVDLAGGSILVYEIDRDYWKGLSDGQKADVPGKLASRLKRRIDPNNLLEVTIRPINTEPPRVEIILPMTIGRKDGAAGDKTGQAQIDEIKSRITQVGRLEFRLLADTRPIEGVSDADAMVACKSYLDDVKWTPDVKNVPPVPPELKDRYGWLELSEEDARTFRFNAATPEGYQQGGATGGYPTCAWWHAGKLNRHFVLTKLPTPSETVTGDDLQAVMANLNNNMKYVGQFRLRSAAAEHMYELTKPVGHYLAIIFDNKVTSAPSLNDRLRESVEVTMGDGPDVKKRVDELVLILQAGALPATLNPAPVAELTIGPSLGADTIRAGLIAVVAAYMAVVVFMIVYYRFAGVVACTALFANLILTVAFMVFVNAAFTLPGLAGLVLMLGMAVDANVLIYERLREEREKGCSLAQAIRNGYDRALPTIIDTHLTSIFTAIVLYVVGTDQLKGFGVSLTVGLVISLFTSLYMTKVMFDYALSSGYVKDLKFMELFKRPNINFMKWRYHWFIGTVALSVIGLLIFLSRGEKGLNIDFTGGTAYTIQFKQGEEIAKVRTEIGAKLPEASVDAIYRDRVIAGGSVTTDFTIRTTEKDREAVRDAVKKTFGERLKWVEVAAAPLTANTAAPPPAVPPAGTPPAASAPAATKPAAPPAATDKLKHKTELAFQNKRFSTPELEQAIEGWFTAEPRKIALPKDSYRLTPVGEGKDGAYEKFTLEFVVPEEIAATTKPEELPAFLAKALRQPVSDRLENFDSQLAAETQQRAIGAIALSWLAIVLYLWFRFGNWTFGVAAVFCLVHDLTFAIGLIGAASYLHTWGVGGFLGLEDFKIDLPAVAALLTLVGYSVNDTIVVFDRIREVRGKNADLSPEMVNDSVNQTLSRTVLASLTTWLVVVVLYIFGGSGVHLFSFVMVVGVLIGTYSSIFVASPLLLMLGEGKIANGGTRRPSANSVPARAS